MKIKVFEMERMQCLYENKVQFNLSESGVLPLKLSEVLDGKDVEEFLAQRLCYNASDGSLLLREHIAQFYPDCHAENVTVTNGGSEANYVTLWTLLEPGGRLAVMVPNYMQAWGMGHAYAGGVDTFQLKIQKEGGKLRWALDIDSLQRAITEKTNVILVTNPNNPNGAVLSESEMDAVVSAARKVGAWLVVDEIYRGAELEGDTTPTFWGRYEKVIITSGLSKAFGLPGLRTGWVVAPPKMIEELWVRHDYLTLTPALLSDQLAAAVMEPRRREQVLDRTRQILRKNLPPVEKWFLERSDLFTYVRPQAGAIIYCEYKAPVNSTELIHRLIAEQSVLLVPGDMLGLDRGIRTGYGYRVEEIIQGLNRVETLMRTL
ncbi:MAG: aminotransferase class I/II-fold pyridoxal phosphate-dependent enzyme [Firmicutes bacterium]|nr:aminotransferase class I/II-fold pyridoxal phosphate-dependent enzyme [Bacillota bacterium]